MSEIKEEKKKTTSKKTKTDAKVKENKTKKVISETKEKKTKKKVNNDVALLNEKDQHNYSLLSKIAKVIVIIIKVCLMIVVPFIFLVMIIIPIFFSKIDIESNIIKYNDMSIIFQDESITFKIGDNIHTFNCDANDIKHITTLLSNNPTGRIITYLEISLLLFGVVVILSIYMLGYLEKILSHFVKEKTPFTEENTNFILSICKLLIAIKIINTLIVMILFGNLSINLETIIEVLFAYIIYYIFKYATLMQNINNTKMCQ